MLPNQNYRFWRTVAECLSGSIALVLVTFACFRLRLDLSTATGLYLFIIVLLSLRGSVFSSVAVSLIAAGCLLYYFVPPVFSFRLNTPGDATVVFSFLLIAIVIARLVSSVRKSAEEALSEIEDRKKAEDALKRSEAYLAHAQELTKAGSWAYKHPDVFEYWSAEMFRMFGFDPARGYPPRSQILARVHPEDRRRVAEALAQQGHDRAFDLKYRIIRPDGQLRVIHAFGTRVFENGIVTRSVGACLDVTAQENLTQEIRRREAFLAEAQRLSHTGSFGW
jgi:PAS domain S-box-containing protein